MITDAHAADGEVIWQPEPEDSAETGVGRFAAFLGGQGIDVGTGYDELWQWSVDEPEQFWELFARFAGVEFGGTAGPVCTTDAMPHTRWFPGRTLNFARHLLQGHEGTALIGIAEDGTREEVTWDALRREVASLAAHLRARGVGHGDRVVGDPSECCRGRRRAARRCLDRRDLVRLRPGVRPGRDRFAVRPARSKGRHRRARATGSAGRTGTAGRSWGRSSPNSPPSSTSSGWGGTRPSRVSQPGFRPWTGHRPWPNRRSSSSRTSSSATRCGSCSPPGQRAFPRASCTATAGRCLRK